MLRVPSSISKEKFHSLELQDMTFVAYRSDVYPEKNEVFFEEFAVIYVISGEKKFLSGSQEIRVEKGDVLFFQRGCYTMNETIGGDYKSLVFFFNERMLREFGEIHPRLLSNHEHVPENVLFLKSDERFRYFIDSFFPHFRSENSLTPFFLRVKFQELLLHLIAIDSSQNLVGVLSNINNGQKIDLEYLIETYYLKPLTISELAKVSGRSVSSFKREFEAKFKTSPASVIKEKRLQYAKIQFENTKKTVQEVCFETGYESVSHFIKAFKEKYGFTPRQLI